MQYLALIIDPEVYCHHLKIDPRVKPVRQKMRRIAPELQAAVKAELKKLQESGIVRKSYYPQWISYMVVVSKKKGGVRICIDFSDLNKAGPKDSFPLPSIDQLVESIVGYEAVILMYAPKSGEVSAPREFRIGPETVKEVSTLDEDLSVIWGRR